MYKSQRVRDSEVEYGLQHLKGEKCPKSPEPYLLKVNQSQTLTS